MPRLVFPAKIVTRSFVVAAVLFFGIGCEGRGIADPPSATDSRESVRARAYIVALNLRTGTLAVSGPTVSALEIGQANAAYGDGAAIGRNSNRAGVSLSLLGTGLVELRASNFSAGTIGAVEAGKVLVRFDLTVVNLLNFFLVTPTFPAPPAGVSGVQVFPLEIRVALASGGPFVLSPPGVGPVQPSLDWSGAPHNFFNDAVCGRANSDCFRYEPFPSLVPFGTSPPGTVGFLVDPSVAEFRVAMLLAANLQSTPTP